MTEAERAGAKARDRAARLERIGCRFGAVKNLEPVAQRIVEHDQILDAPLVGERAGAAGDFDTAVVQMRREGVERRRVGGFPAEKADAFAAICIDDDALLAVVHAEGERGARFVDALQAEKAAAIARPVAQILGAYADIAQSLRSGSLQSHCGLVAIILHRWQRTRYDARFCQDRRAGVRERGAVSPKFLFGFDCGVVQEPFQAL